MDAGGGRVAGDARPVSDGAVGLTGGTPSVFCGAATLFQPEDPVAGGAGALITGAHSLYSGASPMTGVPWKVTAEEGSVTAEE